MLIKWGLDMSDLYLAVMLTDGVKGDFCQALAGGAVGCDIPGIFDYAECWCFTRKTM